LKDLINEAWTHDDDMTENMARPDNYTVHINERKTFARAVEGMVWLGYVTTPNSLVVSIACTISYILIHCVG